MKNKLRLVIVILIGIALLSYSVIADLAPKPTMSFNIIDETSNHARFLGGEQFQCEDQNCVNMTPLGTLGPQQFTCRGDSCRSLAYGYRPYQKLVLNFSDKLRESSIFSTESFNAEFNVKVTDSQLSVEETTPVISKGGTFPSFIKALIITMLLELLVAIIYLSATKTSKGVLVSVLIGNIISLPMVWFLFPLMSTIISAFPIFVLSELFAVVFEAYLIHYMNKQIISLKKSFILSILMNIVSVIWGGIIFLILNYMI